MAVDIHKGYPYSVLEDSYNPKEGEAIEEGMFVVLNNSEELQKAVGDADEYAMMAMNDQTDRFIENGEKVQVVKENASLLTDRFISGPAYVPHAKLQVSTVVGEEGFVTLHAGGAAPIVGRFIRFVQEKDKTMMVFDLVRH